MRPWEAIAGVALGAASMYPLSLKLWDLNGNELSVAEAFPRVAVLYVVLGGLSFVSGFGFIRFIRFLRFGRKAIRDREIARAPSMSDEALWLELQHGKLGEELRMRRLQAFEENEHANSVLQDCEPARKPGAAE
jgi:hypothetical protein